MPFCWLFFAALALVGINHCILGPVAYKVSMISPSTTCSWNNIQINQSKSRDNFSGNICFGLMIRVRCFYTLVNQLSFHTDFRFKLWVGLGLRVGIGFSLYFFSNVNPGLTKDLDPGACLFLAKSRQPLLFNFNYTSLPFCNWLKKLWPGLIKQIWWLTFWN